jgi:16S rRNA G527 N7-methylase RsmG
MNDELETVLERVCRGLIETLSRNFCLEELRETTKNLTQYSRCPSRESNWELHVYRSRALTFRPTNEDSVVDIASGCGLDVRGLGV